MSKAQHIHHTKQTKPLFTSDSLATTLRQAVMCLGQRVQQ